LTYSTPEKGDLDRKLSELMHESRHKLRAAEQRADRPWQHGRIVVENFARADEIHKEAMERAKVLAATFIQRTGRPALEVVEWARPHLENLNRSLIGGIPPETRGEYERLRLQHEAIFSQRLDGLLRDLEIGFEPVEGFAPPTPDIPFITFAEATSAPPSNPPVGSTDTQSGPVEPFAQLGPRPVPRVITATIEERLSVGETVSVERRLSERPEDIREAARALSRAISEQIEDLNASRLNDPDALDRQGAFIAFLHVERKNQREARGCKDARPNERQFDVQECSQPVRTTHRCRLDIEPLGPRKVKNSPRLTVSDRLSAVTAGPNRLLRRSSSRMTSAIGRNHLGTILYRGGHRDPTFEIGRGGHVANSNLGNGILRPETFGKTRQELPLRIAGPLLRPVLGEASY
jgi:hypothetical protein